ncbi:UDP-glucose--hexose-1-phosphate uridylyltransferase [Aquibacillus koreensis]|uniref:Galactose-1-phosphate uridylyltransferase n=1 Tax=Aquibacillus koreensis TaxID=279446 RepID=A0A9X4AJQ9_9BACI|nr:UDP-glucose--hexose-1-phosphate uridylyltransferase [Aquibacillus koreensis]MCT2535441.1 UDP-glucose--hexose-1-phosphate uridylyltransferase [Aquibacillus koreensis]MDC3422276.1 UDP-glucose--hexose-1-phosphate uridylyltransferase [Aquibacillus koreensis]
MSKSIYVSIAQLVEKSVEAALIEPNDSIYARNQLLGLLQLKDYEENSNLPTDVTIPDLVEEIMNYAVKNGTIENILDEKEIFSAKIMNCFLSKPSEVNKTFYNLYNEDPKLATDYFYELSKNSNYIQMKRISNNIQFKTTTPYGDLDITINLSKPEKDPEQIKREKALKQTINYPKCLLCAENEGYVGRIGHPARSNHRIIEVPLEGERWYLQYSPYVYYNEHSIVFAGEHRDMKISRATFERLTAFIEKFPHYFIGSNADLPIVGGSILSHDHYQAGNYMFAMANAPSEFAFDLFSDVNASVVKWPMSVIRLNSGDRNSLVDAATHILERWKVYSDPEAEVYAYTGETPHNTITPIARVHDGLYELDLVLRNNRTTDEHPLGIFHPHADVHHIKKENIGLIEVMGLAVLPPRLKEELDEIKLHLLDGKTAVRDYHKAWVEEIHTTYKSLNASNVNQIVQNALGKKFARVLEDAGVFKTDESGRSAFKRFIGSLNN